VTGVESCGDECRNAISALDRLLTEHPENPERAFIEATQSLVRLRDRLIAMKREAPLDDAARDRLRHTNSVISVLMAGHYPVEGIRWDCIKQARDALSVTPSFGYSTDG
jgi:hypothetical protein